MATPKNNSVIKAFDILKLLSKQDRPLSPQEIAEATDTNLSTTHRFLLTLEEIGAVARRAGHRFHLGMLMSELGRTTVKREILSDRARIHVETLAEDVGETVSLYLFHPSGIERIVSHEPARPLVYREPYGTELELQTSSIGKLYLSQLPTLACEERLAALHLVPHTPHSIVDLRALRRELRDIRKHGFALSREEMELGLDCVSVPIDLGQGEVLGGLTISGPTTRVRGASFEGLLAKARGTVHAISDSVFVESRTVAGKAKPRGSFPHVKRAGNLLFVSGTSSRRPDDSFVGAHMTASGKVDFDCGAQTTETLRNISDILNSVGTGADRIVHLEAYLTHPEWADALHDSVAAFFDGKPPSASVIAVKGLPHPNQIVMIKATAAVG